MLVGVTRQHWEVQPSGRRSAQGWARRGRLGEGALSGESTGVRPWTVHLHPLKELAPSCPRGQGHLQIKSAVAWSPYPSWAGVRGTMRWSQVACTYPSLAAPLGSWTRVLYHQCSGGGKAVPLWGLKQALCGPCLFTRNFHGASWRLGGVAQVSQELRRQSLA